MKKLLLTVLVFTKLFSANAQNLTLNYTKNFLQSEEIKVVNSKIIAQTLQQLTVGYSRQLAKSNFNVNVSIVAATNAPPKPHKLLPCPECTISLAKAPEGSLIVLMKPKSTSLNLLVGLGYTLPHKAGSRLTFSVNVDGGIAVNGEQAFETTYKEKLIQSIPFEKYQKIINPSLNMRIGLTDRLGINIGGGYSNIGSVNLTTGLSFGPSRKKEI